MCPANPLSVDDLAYLTDERFLLLLDSLPFMAFVAVRDGQDARYNRSFVAYVGFIPGPQRADRTALHHPDDQPILELARSPAVELDRSYAVDARIRRHDGTYRWHYIENRPLFREGRRIAYLGTAVDIHDARTANEVLEERVRERTSQLQETNQRLIVGETRYRELYNRTPVALQSSNANARLVEVNDTWLELFGYKRPDVIGRSPTEFMTDASARDYREVAWPEMLGSQGAVKVMDYQFVAASGRVFDGRLAARGVFDESGLLIRTWSAIADVTAEKQAQKLLQQTQRLEAFGQLTAGVAHDFNNLLTAILGSLELAARPGQEESRRARLIAGAQSAAHRGARLTGQLLAFARQQRISTEPVDVNALLDRMRPLLEGSIQASVQLTIAPAPELPPALADTTQLELAILNLAINARDALNGCGEIRISTLEVTTGEPLRPEEPASGRYVAVEVADNGPGIPLSVRERIFEPFFTTKGVGRGSGLGLSQVLGIAKQLGGGICMRSTVGVGAGRGTVMRLMLPIGGIAMANSLSERAHDSIPKARPSQIMLVDDDPDVRAIAGAILREAGHTVTELGSGPEALNALTLRNGDVDLLIADMIMPAMSGVELAEKAQAAWPGLRLLFMTGYADIELLTLVDSRTVLSKPFQAVELERRVSLALGAAPKTSTPKNALVSDRLCSSTSPESKRP